MPAYAWEPKPDKTGKYNLSVVNYEVLEDVKKQYQNSQGWQNFAKLGIKNPYLKKILLDKYSGVCQFCHRPIVSKFVLHHLTYKHICNKDRVSVLCPTKTYPERKLKLPDCENCDDKCIDKLVPVHPYCNKLLADIRDIMTKKDVNMY